MRLTRRGLFGLVGGAAATTATRALGAHVATPSTENVGLLYDATRCIGCKACVVRCREVNHLAPVTAHGAQWDAPDDLDGQTKNVIRVARDGDKTSFVKSQCMHCIDPACVSVCMMSALHKTAGGIVAYDVDRCIGCRYCQVACPFDIPKFEWASTTPRIVKCELCRDRLADGKLPGCVEVCPRQAVIYGARDELLVEAHKRIDARPELYQPKVYGEHDGGGTQALYLAAMPFAKLGLPALPDESMPSLPRKIQHAVYRGFALPAALYAALGFVIWRNRKKDRSDEKAQVKP